jgi:hypothetical protein
LWLSWTRSLLWELVNWILVVVWTKAIETNVCRSRLFPQWHDAQPTSSRCAILKSIIFQLPCWNAISRAQHGGTTLHRITPNIPSNTYPVGSFLILACCWFNNENILYLSDGSPCNFRYSLPK